MRFFWKAALECVRRCSLLHAFRNSRYSCSIRPLNHAMKITKLPDNFDQGEAEAQMNVLTLRCRYLAAEIEQKTKQKIPPPAMTGSLIENVRTLEAHCEMLEGKSIRRGIPATAPRHLGLIAATAATGSEKGKALSFTEKIFRYHGVSNMAELNAVKNPPPPPRLDGETLTAWMKRTALSRNPKLVAGDGATAVKFAPPSPRREGETFTHGAL